MSVDWTDEAASAAALRGRGVETDLDDAALHAYAKDAVASIRARGLGPATDVEVLFDGWGQRIVQLVPAAATITSLELDGVTIDEAEYRIRPGGQFLERLDAYGYPSVFRGYGRIVYDAAAADDRYDRVVVDLVKLALEYSGLDARRDGDYSEESKGARGGGSGNNYQAERDLLISELVSGWAFA